MCKVFWLLVIINTCMDLFRVLFKCEYVIVIASLKLRSLWVIMVDS